MTALILIPTDAERRLLEPLLEPSGAEPRWRIELCGFGPIAAAARSAQLIGETSPAEVLLVGIAGTLDPSAAAIGSAHRFDSVRCYGVGAGSDADHQSAAQMGWAHWEGEPRIGEQLPLAADASAPAGSGELLTCCAASATPGEAQARAEAFPEAVAEDMEGFAVAVSCRLAGMPLSIVRGISNRAGDREKTRWKIPAALAAAAELSRRVLSR